MFLHDREGGREGWDRRERGGWDRWERESVWVSSVLYAIAEEREVRNRKKPETGELHPLSSSTESETGTRSFDFPRGVRKTPVPSKSTTNQTKNAFSVWCGHWWDWVWFGKGSILFSTVIRVGGAFRRIKFGIWMLPVHRIWGSWCSFFKWEAWRHRGQMGL